MKFMIIYYLAYGQIYRYYLTNQIALDLKKQNKRAKDEKDISKTVGRDVDSVLKNEIDTMIDEIDDRYEHDSSQPFQLTNITFEEIFKRLEYFLNFKFGQISLKLYKHYYSESIGGLMNFLVIFTFLIVNIICSKYSIFLYFLT